MILFQRALPKWPIVKKLALVSYSAPNSCASESGTYTTELHVKYDPKRIIEEVEVAAVGEDVRY